MRTLEGETEDGREGRERAADAQDGRLGQTERRLALPDSTRKGMGQTTLPLQEWRSFGTARTWDHAGNATRWAAHS